MTGFLRGLFGMKEAALPVFADGKDTGLLSFPRYTRCLVKMNSGTFLAADSISFFYSHKEIIENEIYRFPAERDRPVIVDCGANCGLSVMYFKQLMPKAKVVAIEADPSVFQILKRNVHHFRFSDVTLHHRAISNSVQPVTFQVEGADAGRVIGPDRCATNVVSVGPILLDDLIGNERVDFLKMDIEGAEVDVLLESRRLNQVDRMFVEYHSFKDAPQRLHDLLACIGNAGFRYYVDVVETPKRPFEQITDYLGMDLQLNISCVRNH